MTGPLTSQTMSQVDVSGCAMLLDPPEPLLDGLFVNRVACQRWGKGFPGFLTGPPAVTAERSTDDSSCHDHRWMGVLSSSGLSSDQAIVEMVSAKSEEEPRKERNSPLDQAPQVHVYCHILHAQSRLSTLRNLSRF